MHSMLQFFFSANYLRGVLLHAMYPSKYTRDCKFCNMPNTLYHIIWECNKNPQTMPIQASAEDQWAFQVTSPSPKD